MCISEYDWYTDTIHTLLRYDWYTDTIHTLLQYDWYTDTIHTLLQYDWYTDTIHTLLQYNLVWCNLELLRCLCPSFLLSSTSHPVFPIRITPLFCIGLINTYKESWDTMTPPELTRYTPVTWVLQPAVPGLLKHVRDNLQLFVSHSLYKRKSSTCVIILTAKLKF